MLSVLLCLPKPTLTAVLQLLLSQNTGSVHSECKKYELGLCQHFLLII